MAWRMRSSRPGDPSGGDALRGGEGAGSGGSEGSGGGGGGGGAYLEPYRDMVRRVGTRFESLLWSSRETQMARFEAIAEMVDLEGRVVLDAGCGHADFALFMREMGIGYGRYIGVEALPEMIGEARRRGIARTEFVQADFVADEKLFETIRPGPAVIVFSGSLNTLEQDGAIRVLERAWRACSEALVFNFLCVGRRHEEGRLPGSPVRKFDAAAMTAWAMDRTLLMAYRQEYLAGTDGTVAMWVG